MTAALYLINVLNNLNTSLEILLVLLGLGVIIGSFATAMQFDLNGEEAGHKFLSIVKKMIITFVVLISVKVLIPNEKTMYLMLGTEVAKEIATNPKVQEVGNKVFEIVNSKLDEIIKQDNKSENKGDKK